METPACSKDAFSFIILWTLSEEIREKYGLLLSPALAIEGVVVAQGRVYNPKRIAGLLEG
jgi:hypothetical protein